MRRPFCEFSLMSDAAQARVHLLDHAQVATSSTVSRV
jgi:hypothetical protein